MEPTLKRWFTEPPCHPPVVGGLDDPLHARNRLRRLLPRDPQDGCHGQAQKLPPGPGERDVGTPVAMSRTIQDAIPGADS